MWASFPSSTRESAHQFLGIPCYLCSGSHYDISERVTGRFGAWDRRWSPSTTNRRTKSCPRGDQQTSYPNRFSQEWTWIPMEGLYRGCLRAHLRFHSSRFFAFLGTLFLLLSTPSWEPRFLVQVQWFRRLRSFQRWGSRRHDRIYCEPIPSKSWWSQTSLYVLIAIQSSFLLEKAQTSLTR